MNVKTVYIEITNQCNLNCQTCYNRSGLNLVKKELSMEQIQKIVAILSNYGANRFLFSGGEPSLYSEFDRLLSWIGSHPEFSFGFVTNGSSRNPSFIHLLKSSPNVSLQISLDGSSEEQNKKTRGAGHFEHAVEFAKMVKSPVQRPLLKMVISQKNLSDVEPFYRLAASLGCIPEFAFIYKCGNAVIDWEGKRVSAQDKIKILNQIYRLNQEYEMDAFLPRCTSTCPFVHGANNLSVCVKTDGSIQPCQSLYSSDYTLGNALHFDEQEFAQNLGHLCAIARKRASSDFGCAKCMLNRVCGRGCMAEAVLLTGDPLGNDEGCLYRKLQLLNHDIPKQKL